MLEGKKIGVALTGSFCTFTEIIPIIKSIIDQGAQLLPIMSEISYSTSTRFGDSNKFINDIEGLTNQKIISSIKDAEPIGPRALLDILVIMPCTGNTLSKIANAITDTVVTMATKAHLRNEKPVVIGISTNDGLGANAKNLGILLNSKNVFFIPFRQDSPFDKHNSLISDFSLTIPTIIEAFSNKQIQPILLSSTKK